MDIYLMYLRKSQMDRDYETISVEETLKRHKKILLDLAARMNIFIKEENIYEEVVSGESIASRPKMQIILERISNENIKGVLCMDTERLSRGDSIDAGIVQQSFMYSNTLIVTPTKIYDLRNENDEQYIGMNFMFGRWELKTITKRLVRGRNTSAEEGRYLGSVAPYGYMIVKIQGDKGNTLIPDEHEADVVRIIYDLYANHNLGYEKIAKQLNGMNFKMRSGNNWTKSTISNIIRNPCYAGKIRWKYSVQEKKLIDGKVSKSRVTNPDCNVYEGMHPAIISEELYNKVQSMLGTHTPFGDKKQFKNILAGLIFCEHCGSRVERSMDRYGAGRYRCTNRECPSGSAAEDVVLDAVHASMKLWLKRYKVDLKVERKNTNVSSFHETALANLKKELETNEKQLLNAKVFLEREIYSLEEYMERKETLSANISSLKNRISEIEEQKQSADMESQSIETLLPKMEYVIDSWDVLSTEELNELLKLVLKKVTYKKDKMQKGEHQKPLEINIYPVLQRS